MSQKALEVLTSQSDDEEPESIQAKKEKPDKHTLI